MAFLTGHLPWALETMLEVLKKLSTNKLMHLSCGGPGSHADLCTGEPIPTLIDQIRLQNTVPRTLRVPRPGAGTHHGCDVTAELTTHSTSLGKITNK